MKKSKNQNFKRSTQAVVGIRFKYIDWIKHASRGHRGLFTQYYIETLFDDLTYVIHDSMKSFLLTMRQYVHAAFCFVVTTLQWRNDERDGVSNHQPHDYLLNRLFRRRWKKTSKLRVTGLCEGNSPVTGKFPVQMVSNAENVSIWWRHHA